MSRYKINDQYGLNFLTLTVVDWVDVFIRKSYGWVEQAEHYSYSSATNYAIGTGLLDVALVDLPLSWVGYVPGT